MTQIRTALQHAVNKIALMSPTPQLDAEVLLAHILNVSRSHFFAHPELELTLSQLNEFNAVVERRVNGEPIAYILGKSEFWSLELLVSPDTLVPRPETELLVETVLALPIAESDSLKVADLGTGSGAIAIAIAHEKPNWDVFATDISLNALEIAGKNAQRLGISRLSFYHGSWCTALPCNNFDVIITNPPYIAESEWPDFEKGLEHEPRSALVSGEDGLDAIRDISQNARLYLKAGGYLLIEHGYLQGESIRALLQQDGYKAVQTLKDLNNHDRVTFGQR